MQSTIEQTPERIELAPNWVVAEMPPGYGTRVAEIRRLTAELEGMHRFARLLFERGERLADAVVDLFTALDLGPERLDSLALAVRLDAGRRLLIQVSCEEQTIQKKSPEVARLFRLMQETAGDFDRVVLVTNQDPEKRPGERMDALAPDAETFLRRMGANHVSGAALFALWKLSLQDRAAAREQLLYLQAHEGGTFDLERSALMR